MTNKKQPEMTEEEMREKLNDMGIDSEEWSSMGGGSPRHPAFVLRMAGNAQKLKSMLEQQVGLKQAEIQTLQEKLIRLKYGGGS